MQYNRITPVFLVGMFLCSLVVPMGLVNNASATSTSQAPTAFLESWDIETNNVRICNPTSSNDFQGIFEYDCDFDDQMILAEHVSLSYDNDDLGNHYYAVTGSNGGIGGYQHSGSGIHIYKFDVNGTFVWRQSIDTSGSYCGSIYSSACAIKGLHIIQEDEFYIVMELRDPQTVTFNSQLSLSLSGYNADCLLFRFRMGLGRS